MEKVLNERDPHKSAKYFLFGLARTLDPHDPSNPIKPIPYEPQIIEYADWWVDEPLIFVEKSRQELVSWVNVALYTWEAIVVPYRFTFFQARKLKDAGVGPPDMALCWRTIFILKHIPESVRPQYHVRRKDHIVEFLDSGSTIMGVSADFDGFRLYTGSGVLGDELATQAKAEQGYTAAKSALGDSGRYTGLSTPNGKNFFYRKVHDIE